MKPTKGEIYSACFLVESSNIFIVTCNDIYPNSNESEFIKIFDITGGIVKKMKNSNTRTFFIETYFGKKNSKIYIVTGNKNFIRAYDYENNAIYHTYYDNKQQFHCSLIIVEDKYITKIFDVCDFEIRVWNFHTTELLQRMKIKETRCYTICLWSKDYIFVGCKDASLKLFDIKNEKLIKNFYGHKKEIMTIRKIYHPIYGQCLITQGGEKDKIKIWGANPLFYINEKY